VAATLTNQYQKPAATETDANAPLTVRLARDLADGINNAKFYANASKLFSYIFIPTLTTFVGDTNNNIIFAFAPRFCPQEFNKLQITIGHKRIAGTDDITLYIYSLTTLYTGPQIMDVVAYGGRAYNTTSIVTDSDTHAISTTTLDIEKSTDNMIYLVLTAVAGDTSSQAEYTTFDATPRYA